MGDLTPGLLNTIATELLQKTEPTDTQPVTVLDASGGDSCMDTTNNALRVNVVAGGAGDGAILDGVTSSIKATVLDFANSNPLAVRLSDTNGDYVAAGAGTQYTEDAAAAADPIGTALIMVRDDALSGQTTLDGDNVAARGTDKGELYVKHADSVAVTGTFWQATQPVSAASLPLPTGAATSALQLPDGHNVTVDNGAGAAAVNIQDGGNAVTVDWAGTAPPIGAGLEATALRVTVATDSTGVLSVDDNGSALTVDNAGTFAVQDSAAETSLAVMDDWDNAASDGASVSGDVAHDTGDAGEPVKIGAKAVASVLAQTVVTANDRTNVFADIDGVLVSRPQVTLGDCLSERVSNTDGASTACTGAFAATASQRIYLTTIIVHNAHATTNGYVDIRDGTAGSVLMTIPLPATGGAVVPLSVPLRFTANTAVAYDVSAAITTIYLTFIGFKSKA